MALPAVDPDARLLALIDAAEPRLRRALTNALVAAATLSFSDEFIELLELGRFEEAIEVAVRTGILRLTDETAAVFVLAGRDTAELLTDVLEINVGFDQVNERAVRIMQADRLRLIREFDAGQRLATRAALADGIRRGLNPVDQARNFRGSIGLTERQQLSVERFRSLLETGSMDVLRRRLRDRRFDSTVRRAILEDRPLTAAQVDRMVDRYRERLVAFRASTIARTEALRAVHAGSDEAYRQAIGAGLLDADQLERTWNTARDERVRASHRGLNGETRGVDETFPGLAGPLRFPGDPNAPASETVQCRCALSTRIGAPAAV